MEKYQEQQVEHKMQKSSRLIGGDGTGGDVTEADQDTQLEEQLKETG